jgi:hypothetical protein
MTEARNCALFCNLYSKQTYVQLQTLSTSLDASTITCLYLSLDKQLTPYMFLLRIFQERFSLSLLLCLRTLGEIYSGSFVK